MGSVAGAGTLAEKQGKKLYEGVVAAAETKGTFKFVGGDGNVNVSVYVQKASGLTPKAVKVTVEEA